MSESQDNHAKTQRLMRYADGETDHAESIDVLKDMASSPDDARAAAHQQQLKDAVSRVMSSHTPATPQELRDRISRLAAETPVDHGPIARIGFTQRWAPAIAAAILVAVGIGLFYNASSNTPSDPTFQTIAGHHAASGLIQSSQLTRYAKRHEMCATNPEQLHRGAMPAQLQRVPDAIQQHLSVASPVPGLDLTTWGYAFAGAGECRIPGDPSVHLVYRAIDNASAPALSLWMCPDDGRYDIPEGDVYRVADQTAKHPMAVWRNAGILYYLVGDSPDPVDQIASNLSVRH